MIKIITKFGIARISLIFFTLMCSVFTSENAFSIRWDKRCAKVDYDQRTNSINFSFLFHLFSFDPAENANLDWCVFSYSVGGRPYINLITFTTYDQKDADRVSILIRNNRRDKNIQYFTTQNPTIGTKLPEGKEALTVQVEAKKFTTGTNEVTHKIAFLTLKWNLKEVPKYTIYIKIAGMWCANNSKSQGNSINLVYQLDNIKSNTNTMKNIPSELNSEISNKVKVAGETDEINVTGAEPGEIIKIYTVSGIEDKSVPANDNVVKIKLPTNQIFIVKTGQDLYKLAL